MHCGTICPRAQVHQAACAIALEEVLQHGAVLRLTRTFQGTTMLVWTKRHHHLQDASGLAGSDGQRTCREPRLQEGARRHELKDRRAH